MSSRHDDENVEVDKDGEDSKTSIKFCGTLSFIIILNNKRTRTEVIA